MSGREKSAGLYLSQETHVLAIATPSFVLAVFKSSAIDVLT